MIKFFRKIRRRLLADNRIGKYLLYAIGEIALVVIGILIAMQLNNWNEHQKQIKLENEYYCRLLEDAILDIEQTSNLLTLAQDRLSASNQAVRLLLNGNVQKVEIGNQIFLSTKAIYSDFKPNNSAYEDLKSGANLNIIGDKSIIKALNQYFNKVEELKSIIMVNGKYAVEILFAHNNNFANGSNQASLRAGGRFSTGLEQDVKDVMQINDNDILSNEMKTRLLNEALEYVSVNTRQVELYKLMLKEIHVLEDILESKCQENE
ncbi:DUF6090 family protein [Maribacter cobaltidurans]|uniref:Uncharacterized protein n=1 Tax=Maribacter cobaltidurans TaxID=1178778 RepID=A0A223V994_9FLAO|nr:DUF6090 family protein [Maribacter cobaltidurans]ASV31975.1 hypothetical protein CJ263_18110 [Maribacter cobaltidurans]GGD86164.1 hypothetical protein GCM10011412_24970 [Maribacter cobaltidurans]